MVKKKTSKEIEDDIRQIHDMLNNKKIEGTEKKISENLYYVRYLLTLHWATCSSLYEPHAKIIDGQKFFRLYQLKRAATQLDLIYDKSHAAPKVYADSERLGEIIKCDNNGIHYSITEKGIRVLDIRVEEMKRIKKDLQDYYSGDQSKGEAISKQEISRSILRRIFRISRTVQ